MEERHSPKVHPPVVFRAIILENSPIYTVFQQFPTKGGGGDDVHKGNSRREYPILRKVSENAFGPEPHAYPAKSFRRNIYPLVAHSNL